MIFDSKDCPKQTIADTFKDFKIIYPAQKRDVFVILDSPEIASSWKEQIFDRLKKKNYGLLIVMSDQELAYFAWITLDLEFDKYLGFSSHSFSTRPYLFHCYTLKKFRLRKLHTSATTFLIGQSNQKLWGIIYNNNKPAIRAWLKAGMLKVGYIKSIKIFGFQKTSIIRQ